MDACRGKKNFYGFDVPVVAAGSPGFGFFRLRPKGLQANTFNQKVANSRLPVGFRCLRKTCTLKVEVQW